MFFKRGDIQPIVKVYEEEPSDIDGNSVKKALKKTMETIKKIENEIALRVKDSEK